MAPREWKKDVNFSSLLFYFFIMQGERKDMGNWALFPENKSFATAVSVFLGV